MNSYNSCEYSNALPTHSLTHYLMRSVRFSRKLAKVRALLLLWKFNFMVKKPFTIYEITMCMHCSLTVFSLIIFLWWPLSLSTAAIKSHAQVSHITSGFLHHVIMHPNA